MIVSVFKVKEANTIGCYNDDCKRLPEYIEYQPRISLWQGERYWIKKDTICACFTLGSAGEMNSEYYCRGCIDWLYKKIKSKLDTKLWVYR